MNHQKNVFFETHFVEMRGEVLLFWLYCLFDFLVRIVERSLRIPVYEQSMFYKNFAQISSFSLC
ncbi:MAG: hypothetical protein PWQ64_898 [Desulfomicrobiaceae bacterium]|nr:hypothetical protein [Desulfomicrobiaceae bacterium]